LCYNRNCFNNTSKLGIGEIKNMTDVIYHIIHEGEGFAELDDYQLFLGHRRLDTVPKNAKQPLIYLNRYIITYNGEIYNYIKIKSE